jgi:uncharacterized tellurite resistance protein B-like protein
MAIFGSLGRSSALDRPWSPQEAASGILLAIIASDGEISDDEVAAFNGVAQGHPIFRDQPSQAFGRMIDEQFSILRKTGWESLFDKGAADLPPDIAQTVFVLAVDLVLSDGSVEESEEYLIGKLRDALRISEELVATAVQVLSIKYAVS